MKKGISVNTKGENESKKNGNKNDKFKSNKK